RESFQRLPKQRLPTPFLRLFFVPNSADNTNWGSPANPAPYTPSHYGTAPYFILPYIEQDNIYNSPAVFNPGTGQSNSYNLNNVIKTFQGPMDPSMLAGGLTWGNRGALSYLANWHVFRGGMNEDWQVGGVTRFPSGIPDGTSNTIFFFESYAVC